MSATLHEQTAHGHKQAFVEAHEPEADNFCSLKQITMAIMGVRR